MTSAKIALVLATATVVAWGVKALVIWQAGGLDKSDFEGPLFLLGFLLCVASWVAIGVASTAGRPTWLRAVGGVLGVVAALVVVQVFDALSGAIISNSGWVHEEAGLWTAAIVTFLVAWLLFRSRARTRPVAAIA
jgi:hypothetical protein